MYKIDIITRKKEHIQEDDTQKETYKRKVIACEQKHITGKEEHANRNR